MPDWIFWVGGFFVLGAVGAYAAKKRAESARAVAERLGFTYAGDGSYDTVGPFALLGYPTTIAPALRNLSRATRDGLLLTLFDWSTEFNDFTSVVLRAEGLALPHFAVSPPSILSAKGGRLYRPKLSTPFEFTERPGFNRDYWATAEVTSTREVFTPALLDRLQRDPGWYLEAIGDRVLVAKTKLGANQRSQFLEPGEVEGFLDDALALFRLVAVRAGWEAPARRP